MSCRQDARTVVGQSAQSNAGETRARVSVGARTAWPVRHARVLRNQQPGRRRYRGPATALLPAAHPSRGNACLRRCGGGSGASCRRRPVTAGFDCGGLTAKSGALDNGPAQLRRAESHQIRRANGPPTAGPMTRTLFLQRLLAVQACMIEHCSGERSQVPPGLRDLRAMFVPRSQRAPEDGGGRSGRRVHLHCGIAAERLDRRTAWMRRGALSIVIALRDRVFDCFV